MIRNGRELQTAMQILYCTELEDLMGLFNERNSEGWIRERFELLRKNPADFLVRLDGINLQLVMDYIDEQLTVQLGELREPGGLFR